MKVQVVCLHSSAGAELCVAEILLVLIHCVDRTKDGLFFSAWIMRYYNHVTHAIESRSSCIESSDKQDCV